MKKIFFTGIVVFITGMSFAQNPNLGTSGAQFLQIPIGARESAMGGAVVGLTDDAAAVFWNPSGIAGINSVDAHFSYAKWFNLFDLNAVSLAYNSGDAGVFAASLISFSTGKMEMTTVQEPNGTGRFFDAQDLAVGISYARFLTDQFSVGVTAKYVYQRIWNEVADGLAFDVGTQYTLDFQNLTIAMTMSNFGADIRYDGPDLDVNVTQNENFPNSRITPGRLQTDAFSLPLNFQVGIGFDIYETDFVKIRGDIDAVHPNDNSEKLHFGTEFNFFDRIFIRGGYRFNYDDEDFTFGAGANVPFSGAAIRFDYSYSIFNILPSVHRISVGLDF